MLIKMSLRMKITTRKQSHIRDPSDVVSIFSLVRILMRQFPVIIFFLYNCLNVAFLLHNKKKTIRWLEDMNLIFSC